MRKNTSGAERNIWVMGKMTSDIRNITWTWMWWFTKEYFDMSIAMIFEWNFDHRGRASNPCFLLPGWERGCSFLQTWGLGQEQTSDGIITLFVIQFVSYVREGRGFSSNITSKTCYVAKDSEIFWSGNSAWNVASWIILGLKLPLFSRRRQFSAIATRKSSFLS